MEQYSMMFGSYSQPLAHAQPIGRTELICPQPRRTARMPFLMETSNRASPKFGGAMWMYRTDSSPDILDMILSKNDYDYDLDQSGQMGFFSGSPPVRANNPIVRDPQFIKHSQQSSLASSPLVSSFGKKSAAGGRAEAGSPVCGTVPKVRIEGFACGNSDPHCAVPTFA